MLFFRIVLCRVLQESNVAGSIQALFCLKCSSTIAKNVCVVRMNEGSRGCEKSVCSKNEVASGCEYYVCVVRMRSRPVA